MLYILHLLYTLLLVFQYFALIQLNSCDLNHILVNLIYHIKYDVDIKKTASLLDT